MRAVQALTAGIHAGAALPPIPVAATLPRQVDPATVDDNHSPRATFDDAVVPDMALALAELALRRCARDSTPH